MIKTGFDNEKYLEMQSQHIRERIDKFGGKLYLEFGGKLFDGYHASRVLPGFQPDSKLKMLLNLREQAEIVIVISADALEKNKLRGDLGITYDLDVLRLIDAFRSVELYVGSVVLTQFRDQSKAKQFEKKLENLGVKVYRHYPIEGYPYDVAHIVSDEGYGCNDYIQTSRELVVVTAPGPGSGKMATCLSQLYHDHKHGIKAGYAKFETFPIWNLPLKHPVNLAYEAANRELVRRHMQAKCDFLQDKVGEQTVSKTKLLMKQAGLDISSRPTVAAATEKAEETGAPAAALELNDGTIVLGKTSSLLGASSALLLNALKKLAGLSDEVLLLSPSVIEPIQKLKTKNLGNNNPRLHTDEILIALSICAVTNPTAALAMKQLSKLKGCEMHSTVILSQVDVNVIKKLGINLTTTDQYQTKKLYHKS
ncbi:MAG: DUF1846 domain-containing protein [Clostridia bacterium]|nr:DUF1846 domain-containing protein [Clostridia bacterium]